MRRFVFFIFIVIIIFNPGSLYSQGAGSAGYEFLKLEVDPSIIGMGSAGCASPKPSFASFWNPANICYAQKQIFSFTTTEWVENIKYHYISFVTPWSSKKIIDRQFLIDFEKKNPALPEFIVPWSKSNGDKRPELNPYFEENGNSPFKMGNKVEIPTFKSNYFSSNAKNMNFVSDSSINRYFVINYKNNSGESGLDIMLDMISNDFEIKENAVLSLNIMSDKDLVFVYKDRERNILAQDIKKFSSSKWQKIEIKMSGQDKINSDINILTIKFADEGTVCIDDIKLQSEKKYVKHSFAVSLGLLNSGDMEKYIKIDEPPYYRQDGNFNMYDFMFVLSYGKKLKLKKLFLTGINLKLIREKIDSYTSSAAAVDCGVTYNEKLKGGSCSFAAVIKNIGIGSRLKNRIDKLPFNIKLGVSYTPDKYNLLAAADYNIYYDNMNTLNFGIEYLIKYFALRTGYEISLNKSIRKNFRFGLGFNYNAVTLNYAFLPVYEFDSTHRLSILYKW